MADKKIPKAVPRATPKASSPVVVAKAVEPVEKILDTGTASARQRRLAGAYVAGTTNVPRANPFRELGRPGLRIYSGFLEEEFLPELRGQQAARIYQEMRDNDAIVGAMLYTMEQLVQTAPLEVVTNDTTPEGNRIRDFVESCFNDLSNTWQHTLSEVLSFLPFGYAPMEIILKRRNGFNRDPEKSSKYSDGLIGWRKIALRGQDSTYRWIVDSNGRILGLEQLPPPTFANLVIPMEKMLLFRVRADKNNPEGKSILRHAYRSWFLKKRFEEVEGIAVERELTGLPVLTTPEGVNIWNPNDPDAALVRSVAEDLVRNIRADQHQGVVLPFDWKLELISSKGQRNIDTTGIITRLDQRIATTVLADVLLIGQEKVGSFALVAAKVSLFSKALKGITRVIEDEFNDKAIPRLLRANGFDTESAPFIRFGPIDTPDLKSLAEYINKLVGNQVIVPDEKLERHLRQIASFPQKEKETERLPAAGDVNDPTDDDDDKQEKKTKPREVPSKDPSFARTGRPPKEQSAEPKEESTGNE